MKDDQRRQQEKQKRQKIEQEKEDAKTVEQKEQDVFKNKGNELYKVRKFDEQIGQYDLQIAKCPNDITYYNNKCAVLLELGKFDECEKLINEILEKKYEMNSQSKDLGTRFWPPSSLFRNFMNLSISLENKALNERKK